MDKKCERGLKGLKRKNYWFLFAILLLSLTSLSQGQDLTPNNGGNEERKTSSLYPQPSSPQNTDDHPIRVTVHLSKEDYEELVKINDTYTSETGAVIELINIPDSDAYQQLTSAMAVGEGPDVLLVNSSWIRSMALNGYLLPAESYQSSNAGGDVISPLLQEVQWNGYQWGIPIDMDPYVLVWQRQTLQELGMTDIPNEIKTWNELLAKQENRKDKKLLAIHPSDGFSFAALMGSLGADPMNPGDEDLEWIHKARPFVQFNESDLAKDSWEQLKDQGLAFLLSPVSKAVTNTIGTNYDLRMPEQLYLNYPFLLRARSYAVSAQSQHPKEAAEWIAYMSSGQVQQGWYHDTGKLPALKGNYEETLFNPAELPFRLHRLLQSAGNSQETRQLQSKWDVFSKAAKLFLSGKYTGNEYKKALEGTTVTKVTP